MRDSECGKINELRALAPHKGQTKLVEIYGIAGLCGLILDIKKAMSKTSPFPDFYVASTN